MKRKGFTLVELLIVIVVIGILSAMMMLSSTEATTSAKASNIVSNMRNWKTAGLSYYTDNMDFFTKTKSSGTKDNPVDTNTGTGAPTKTVKNYLNNSAQGTENTGNYSVVWGDNGEWYVKYDFGDLGSSEKAGVAEKLKGRAKSVGLLADATEESTTTGTTTTTAGYAGGTDKIYMRVR